MNLRSILAPLAALLFLLAAGSPALAQSAHEGHDAARKCVWQADTAPAFVPGNSAVYDSGTTTRTSVGFNTLVGRTAWNVVVLPGYQFGWVYAWDEGVPLASTCSKSYARSSYYGVYKTQDCCQPQRTAQAMMSVSFRVRAIQLNAPGSASARGLTHVYAVNSGMTCVAAAATTTRSGDAGQPVTVEVPLPVGGTAKIGINLDFDSESSSLDEASNVTIGPAVAAPDEEYAIVTDLDLNADADGAPWDTAESAADLMHHSLYIRTSVQCTHCLQKVLDELLLVGTGEKSVVNG